MSRADKFRKALQDKIEKLSAANNKVAKVGIVEHQHYDDNTPVAYIAAIHEHGAIFTVPERKATIYRKIAKNGDWTSKHGSEFVKKKLQILRRKSLFLLMWLISLLAHLCAQPFQKRKVSGGI